MSPPHLPACAAEHDPMPVPRRLPRLVWIVLATLLLVAPPLLSVGARVHRQRAAKAALESRGVSVYSAYHGPDWLGSPPEKFDEREEDWEANPWRKLFYDVEVVDAGHIGVSNDGERPKESDLRLLLSFPRLKRLYLCRAAGITDGGLVFVGRLSNLESLDLSYTSIGDRGLAHLVGLNRLTMLDLSSTTVTNAGLMHLARLENLRVLKLSTEGITDEGLRHLATIPRLEELECEFPAPITDRGLAYLANLKNVREIRIGSLDHTAEGVSKLRRALPGAKVIWWSE